MNKDKILSLLGLALKAKKIIIGEEFVIKSIQNKQAKLVILATDSGKNTNKKILNKASFYNIEVIQSFTINEISNAIGKHNRVVVSIIDKGFKDLIKKEMKGD